MGLILDTSVIITGERRGKSVRQILEQLRNEYGETPLAMSVVSIVELSHGVQRAETDERRQRRQAFVEEVLRDLPIHPVTIEIARQAGRIEGAQAVKGLKIAFEDLLIGTTALHLGFGVATSNIRHFQLIPGLSLFKQ